MMTAKAAWTVARQRNLLCDSTSNNTKDRRFETGSVRDDHASAPVFVGLDELGGRPLGNRPPVTSHSLDDVNRSRDWPPPLASGSRRGCRSPVPAAAETPYRT